MNEASGGRTTCLVTMGPSGTGKTTTATGIAARLGWVFAEADDFHPRANIEKMSAGIPLTDEDRWPWLALIAGWIDEQAAAGRDCVITCSALKRRYRDVLRGSQARVRFVELCASPDLVEARLRARQGHYMPASLLASQFADFEPLEADEDGVEIGVDAAPPEVVARALAALGLAPAA
ncbi:gluconokinase [Aurantimonas sp. Leaf443]|uniref:gluconokinase n=1 Tax=Aurantimonas sp. Leaf443 TaxID=1736378 RepID=UPI0006FE290F|nr:gluconokinase [Aurantimonas sp. Leaf443]KQT85545.1 gluconate kinase [Aurantimonas sp. Leaf443]